MNDTIAQKRAYVSRQGQTRNHRCHWPGCKIQVPPAMWGCESHWYRLPYSLRTEIWRTYEIGQEIDMSPSREYLDVARRVQHWIKQNTEKRRAYCGCIEDTGGVVEFCKGHEPIL